MPYYKDLKDKLHFIDSVEFECILPVDSVMISESEANEILVSERAKEQFALTYQQKRAAEYPPLSDLADAISKQHSTDPLVVAEGVSQEAAWASKCLEVKAQIPKP